MMPLRPMCGFTFACGYTLVSHPKRKPSPDSAPPPPKQGVQDCAHNDKPNGQREKNTIAQPVRRTCCVYMTRHGTRVKHQSNAKPVQFSTHTHGNHSPPSVHNKQSQRASELKM